MTCKDIKQRDSSAGSGVYKVMDLGMVYCDMTTHGGGWALCANWVGSGASHTHLHAMLYTAARIAMLSLCYPYAPTTARVFAL